jgi:hypothetical protein
MVSAIKIGRMIGKMAARTPDLNWVRKVKNLGRDAVSLLKRCILNVSLRGETKATEMVFLKSLRREI